MTPNRWLGALPVLWRTRRGRRAGDAGLMLRGITRGADTAVGLRLRGQYVLLLLDPSLVGQLLVEHAPDSMKGPGTQLTRVLLGDGLLTTEGEQHQRARRLVAPAFSPRRLAPYADTFARRGEAHLATWRDGQVVDIHAQMAALTLDLIGRTLLGIDVTDEAAGIRSSLESALASFGDSALAFGRRRPRPESTGAVDAHAVHHVVDAILDERAEHLSDDRGDVVSALLAATAEPDGLTRSEVHDHVVTLLMAGHETTANALSWAMYLLGENPDAEQRLHAEVDRLAGRLPTMTGLSDLPYTRAVIAESMRLYPPAWIVGRTITRDLDFAGWHAPAGAVVAASPLLLHRDPRWFPDPDRFDPSRWLDARREAVARNAYLPFGTGPRSCIGEQFAWAEATTVLAVLAARWSARMQPGHVPQMQYRVTLRPGNGLPMRVHHRP